MTSDDTLTGSQASSAELIVREGHWPGHRFPVTQLAVTIGRHPGNDIAVDDRQVSRRHANLTWDGRYWILQDLGSANGTFVNGERITAARVLQNGDVVGLGAGVQLAFQTQPAAVGSPAAPGTTTEADAASPGILPGRSATPGAWPGVPGAAAPPPASPRLETRGRSRVGVPLQVAVVLISLLLLLAGGGYLLWSWQGERPTSPSRADQRPEPLATQAIWTAEIPTAGSAQPRPTLASAPTASQAALPTQQPDSPPPGSSPPSSLVQPEDLVYLGAFRLPDGPPETGWDWGGGAMTYYPEGDPSGPADGFPGSLFGTGHDWNTYVSEVTIPEPSISSGKNLEELNTASTLQEFQDIGGDLFGYLEVPRVGLEYLPAQGSQTSGKLYFSWAQHMGQGETNPSHGWSELDLSDPQTAGAWRIGEYANFLTGDYLLTIPRDWAESYTPGKTLATGRYQDGGQASEGPALFAIAPWNQGDPPPPGSILPAVPLLRYGNVYQENPVAMDGYHHSDEWSGAAWLTAGEKSAVIFVGTKGQGECWYGYANGVVWPDEEPYPPVPEAPFDDRGWWSDRFVGQILFYDPAHLAAVASGAMEPHEPQPYATLEIDEVLYHIESDRIWHHLAAASFDGERGLLYVFEPLADEDKPLVHVWRVD